MLFILGVSITLNIVFLIVGVILLKVKSKLNFLNFDDDAVVDHISAREFLGK